MTPIVFLEPHLIGKRFEGHSVPLSLLKDFSALSEMVTEIARAKYLADHPDKKRVPKGFSTGIDLQLAQIDEGGAILRILLVLSLSTLFPMDNQESYFCSARDGIVGAIHAAGTGGRVTDYLPQAALGYFDQFGRSLRDDERMELSIPGSDWVATLTKETRRQLILASSANEITDEVTVRGVVSEADKAARTFHVQMANGREVRVPIHQDYRDNVMSAFNGYEAGSKVMVEGIGRYERDGRLREFESIEHILPIDCLDVRARLDELRELHQGWLDGEGDALPEDGLEWLAVRLDDEYPDDLPLPHLYPTPGGNVQAEWSVGGIEITLEIDLSAHNGYWHSLDTKSAEAEDADIDLSSDGAWDSLFAKLRVAGKAAA